MAILCECGHRKSNHESRRDDGRFTGKCKGVRIGNVKHSCGCKWFTIMEKSKKAQQSIDSV